MKGPVKLVLFSFLVTTLILSGCAKFKTNGAAAPTGTSNTQTTNNQTGTIPDTDAHTDILDPSVGVWTTGGSAVFQPESTDIFNKWVGGHPVEPQNVMVNVNLTKASGKPTYYGSVKIRYKTLNTTYEATLKVDNSTYGGNDFYKYNYWFNKDGKQVFSGFLDDKVGGIVLIINQYLNLGDGGGTSEVGGEIWFKNYSQSWAAYDEGGSWSVVLPCWFRSIGPYNCQSNAVINKTSLTPDNYEKLGTFSNMNKLKAFAD